TTDIPPNKKNNKNKKRFLGSPNPLKIEKVYGNSSLDELVKQIYYLSEIHIGSIKSTRLPVTTGYADRISKSVRFIPEGKLDNRLFFL
ncbi:MAG: Piwi domain-containing protein, partial [Candidatus Eremiobacterota bacterium]